MGCFLPRTIKNTIYQLSLVLCSTNCGRPLCFIALVKDLLQSFPGCFSSLRSRLHFVVIPARHYCKKVPKFFLTLLMLLYISNLLDILAQKDHMSISISYFNSLHCLTNAHYLQWQAHIWTHIMYSDRWSDWAKANKLSFVPRGSRSVIVFLSLYRHSVDSKIKIA